MASVGGVRLHLVEVLLSSSLSFCPLAVKVGADLDRGHLGDRGLCLLHNEDLLPSGQLLLLCKKLLL
jgi:hypothetical protein